MPFVDKEPDVDPVTLSLSKHDQPEPQIPDEPAASEDGFAALGLDNDLVAAVAALGYEEPTAIQREAIPPLLGGRDVLGQAATGTGKTAAFALPLLQLIGHGSDQPAVRGFILVPTRELAMQVAEAVHTYGRGRQIRVLPIYGGQSIGQQLRALSRGVDVVVATPGRALDHIGRGTLNLASVKCVVLDEADEMLDMGFADELEAILKVLPAKRQTALFSATMAQRISAIASRHLKDPARVTIAREKTAAGAVPRVREVAYIVQRPYKIAALARVLDVESPSSAIVFCRTRTEVDELTQTLSSRGYRAEALHGGLSQEQRDRVMRRFRDGTAELLVATDVAARGLDVEGVSHVVNFDVPSSPDAYVHRIGRTGRAGREGVAMTFAEPRENRLLRNLEHQTGRKIAIETVPTVTDVRAHRLEATRAAIEEVLAGDGLDDYRVLVNALAESHDVLDIAAAAVKVAQEARDGESKDVEIPNVSIAPPPQRAGGAGRLPDPLRPRGDAPRFQAPEGSNGEVARLYVGAGRSSGVRPGDLVGAIANEAGIGSKDIGAIHVADRFSLVEVPAAAVPHIVKALRGTTIRGKSVEVRLDRGAPSR
jgi:ATP-dependent RNA helicase DeaD